MEENEKQHKNIDAFTLRKSEEILSQIESFVQALQAQTFKSNFLSCFSAGVEKARKCFSVFAKWLAWHFQLFEKELTGCSLIRE